MNILKRNKVPFREFKIKNINEVGELFSYFILETVLLGKLTNINPFDQPAVEQVKTITKIFNLKSSKYYFRSSVFLIIRGFMICSKLLGDDFFYVK